jgi:hypothetical protein
VHLLTRLFVLLLQFLAQVCLPPPHHAVTYHCTRVELVKIVNVHRI